MLLAYFHSMRAREFSSFLLLYEKSNNNNKSENKWLLVFSLQWRHFSVV